jgi:hypothetical protein
MVFATLPLSLSLSPPLSLLLTHPVPVSPILFDLAVSSRRLGLGSLRSS